jgi:signal transduction histidine kinase
MSLRLHVLGWVVVAASFVAAVLFVFGGVASFRLAAVEERERTLAAEIGTSVSRLSALQWQARTEQGVSTPLGASIVQTHGQIEQSLRELAQLDGGESAPIRQAYRAYSAASSRELDALRTRKVDAAKAIDDHSVDPRSASLTSAIGKLTPKLEGEAQRANVQTHRRLLGALIASAVLAVLLAWQFAVQQRGRRADRELLRRSREFGRQKDEFVATVSHELRTPLTSIHGYAELLLQEGGLGTDQTQWVQVIGRNADRLNLLIADLLLIAEVNAGRFSIKLGDVDLTAAVAEAIEAAAPAAKSKGLALTNHTDMQIALQGDKRRLSQVLDNLLSNAIKFTPGGGSVTVRTTRDRGAVVLEVADSGIGIAPAEQRHLFERFYRTDQATQDQIQGTGLGLAISKTIIDAHNGSIAVTSAPGVGTTFRIELPAEDGTSASSDPDTAETFPRQRPRDLAA